MNKVSSSRFSPAAVLIQLIWIWQPATAQVVLPPAFINPNVPHDVATGASASVEELAIFAWQEFIALNWPAVDPAATGKRGQADTSANFLTITADASGNFPLLVWQTYLHKNELFPVSGTPTSFDSNPPAYSYKVNAAPSANAKYNLYNNLDESSELGLCQMFAHTNTRIVYEAKVNRSVFDYIYGGGANALCTATNGCLGFYSAKTNAMSTLRTTGGVCELPASAPVPTLSLPCGDLGVAGEAGEGAIELKAAWRQLTPAEQASGRFYMREVIYYKGGQNSQSGGAQQLYDNAVFGLVGLHIIHKTKSFPTFVFATWEQVDNFDDSTNTNSESLQFLNAGTPLPNIPVTRVHPIHSDVAQVNDAVHVAFKQQAPNSVWQYYKLIGVQGTPMNGPPLGASSDTLSYYFLANIVVESNQTLQSFYGQAPNGLVQPAKNVYLKGAEGSPFQMGGCQGCHGTQGQVVGGDFSAVLSFGPSNSHLFPESIDSDLVTSVASTNERTGRNLKLRRKQRRGSAG